jgi:glycosyltransferase involved in cell wall biosynthesis
MASKRALIHEGIAPDRVQLLPNVVDLDHFDRGPRDADSVTLPERLESMFNFLFVHGLNERKGTPVLLDAFETVQERCEDVSLILVGDNDLDREVYSRQVTGNPDVHHVEYVPDIRDAYNLSDVFVLPSVAAERWKEQFGRVIIESMACGVPSIVTNVGGPPYVVAEGETSLVVEPRSPAALADAMARLYEDDDLRRDIGECAYRYAREQYAPDVVGDDLYDLYRSHVHD